MKKKIVPILVVLAIVAVGIGGYFLGQRSNNSVIEMPPAESSAPEVTPEATPAVATPEVVEPEVVVLSQEELNQYFATIYELIWNDPAYYHTPYGDYPAETDALQSAIEHDGHTYLEGYGDKYFDWKAMMFSENIFLLKFSGDYRNVILAETLPIYGTPHDTVEPIGEYHRFDVIEPAELSEDSKWYRAKDEDGNYFYYKSSDLKAGLSDEEITRLCGEYAAIQKQQEQTQTSEQKPGQTQTPVKQPEQTEQVETPAKQPEQPSQSKPEENKQPEQSSSSGDSIPDYLLNSESHSDREANPVDPNFGEGSTQPEDCSPGDDVAGITGP